MAKSVPSKLRTLYVMDILLQKSDEEHRISTNRIIELLKLNGMSVERKALYDDIETLRDWGMDIIYSKEIPAGYYLGSRSFELPELKLLVDAVQSSKFLTEKKSRELIKKLSSLASEGEARQLQRQVYISNRAKTLNEGIYYNVDKLHEAILSNKKITFLYYKWNTDKELVVRNEGNPYEVSPWALTWDDEKYYMLGYDSNSNKVKHYRVDKMRDIVLTDSYRDGEEAFKDFDLAKFATVTFGMFGGMQERVTLEFENSLIGVVLDRFGPDAMIHKSDENHFRVVHEITVSGQFYGWLAGIGAGVKIVTPDYVAKSYKEYLEGILRNY